MSDLKVGQVTHYYDKISVAVIDLSAPLHKGDHIRISGSNEFIQTVDSIQAEHEQVDSAAAGDTIGLKINQPVKPGDEILKSS